jgi:hypothetical protein
MLSLSTNGPLPLLPTGLPRFGRCPKCRSSLVRVRRRPLDRLLNMGIAAKRLRCASPICGHEFLKKPTTLAAKTRPWVVGTAMAVGLALGYLALEVGTAISPSALPEAASNWRVTAELGDARVP